MRFCDLQGAGQPRLGVPKLWAMVQKWAAMVSGGLPWKEFGGGAMPPSQTAYVGEVATGDGPHPGLEESSAPDRWQNMKWNR